MYINDSKNAIWELNNNTVPKGKNCNTENYRKGLMFRGGRGMSMHRLIHEGFINPYWLNDVKDKENPALVISKDSIELLGKKLILEEYYPLKIGETVYVSMRDGYFYFKTSAEKEEFEKREKQRIEEEKKIALKRQQKRQIEAATFNSRIKVPVRWKSVYKAVISGLSEHSRGNGVKKNSVVHILFEEELLNEKFKRRANELLCSSSDKGNNGIIDATEEYVDITFKSKVTCKKCIEILNKKGWLLE